MRADILELVLEESSSRHERQDDGYGLAGMYRDTERSPGAEWLKARGENWYDFGDKLCMASDAFAAWRSEYQRTPKYRARIGNYREARKAKGLCLDCPSMATAGRQHCDKCRAKRSARASRGQKEAA
jgi:hypothetical protein